MSISRYFEAFRGRGNYKAPLTYVLLALGTLILLVGVWTLLSHPTVESVMRDFHEGTGRAEDMLMDPLILHADLVKDRVIQDVQNPRMDKRRCAIAFLGNERISESLPVLHRILNDETEMDYFRADALESIFRIDEAQGRELAAAHAHRQDYLGRIARGLIDGSHNPYVRSKYDAFLGRHN